VGVLKPSLVSPSPPEVPNEPTAQPGAGAPGQLGALRGLRTAPELSDSQRNQLRAELADALVPCPWFTIGVMAPTATDAVAALRRCEAAFGWPALTAADPASTAIEGPVFLKGNQHTGTYLLRREEGLGEGVLISGQHPDEPTLTDTWGPLPLDLL